MIRRWNVEPLCRSRRRIDERLLMTMPWLARLAFSLIHGRRPGSRLRRLLLGYSARVGIAANNRGDYKAMSVWLSPDVELHLYTDAPDARPVDAEPIYHGREGYVEAVDVLRAGFGAFRWELRELFDPGGKHFGARTERIGSSGLTGAEIRSPEFHVWEVERGMARRQWALASEAAMLALLDQSEEPARLT